MALRHPERTRELTPSSWDLLVRQARRADLLPRIAALLEQRALLADVPPGPAAHLTAARTLATAQQHEVRREVAHIGNALRPLAVPVILLKGAAYLLAELPAALGRMHFDVDILVPKGRLAEVEAALMLAGWAMAEHSEYDEQYYRRWMHEIPPLQHVRRQTVLDVHHAILPATARLKPSSWMLFDAAQPLAGHEGFAILAPPDLVLHSMAHLSHNDELSHGLRDLSDIDFLLRHFGSTTAGFWERLVERARQLHLGRPLYYGLHQAKRILGTPVPAETLRQVRRFAPAWSLERLMQGLWGEALRSPHASTSRALTGVALFALYVRAHWLRMPPGLLARHLVIKAMTRRR